MLESCMRPELVAEITMQPVRRYGVDAAVLYSDIMLPLKAAGVDLDIVSGHGPVIARPIRRSEDLEQLQPLDPDHLWYVTEAVRRIQPYAVDVCSGVESRPGIKDHGKLKEFISAAKAA